MSRKYCWSLLVLAGLLVAPGVRYLRAQASARNAEDWPTFGGDAARSSASTTPTRITAANVASLQRQQVHVDGHRGRVGHLSAGRARQRRGARRVLLHDDLRQDDRARCGHGHRALDLHAAGIRVVVGIRQFTNSTPTADPGRDFIYAASPDGHIEKLAIADGHATCGAPRSRCLPQREKIASPLTYFRGHVIADDRRLLRRRAAVSGARRDSRRGRRTLFHVWNSLCSDRHELITPSSCPEAESAIWGRAGAVDRSADRQYFSLPATASGTGTPTGATRDSNSIADATTFGNYTPTNTDESAGARSQTSDRHRRRCSAAGTLHKAARTAPFACFPRR